MKAWWVSVLFIVSVAGCRDGYNPLSRTKEAWDSPNAPEIFGVHSLRYDVIRQASFRQGKLDRQPWSDTYWPLDKIGLARRWIDPDTAHPFTINASIDGDDDPAHAAAYQAGWDQYNKATNAQIDTAIKDAQTWAGKSWKDTVAISPAEKYDIGVGDGNFSLTRHELQVYATDRKQFHKIDWSWMGHCHGWTPASYLFEPPKYGVLLHNNATGKEVLFTPGDIRGLLTKSAADNPIVPAENYHVMGTRCDDSKIVRDEAGRVIDGAIGVWSFHEHNPGILGRILGEGATPKGFTAYRPIYIVRSNWFGSSEFAPDQIRMLFRFGPDFRHSPLFWLEGVAHVGVGNELEDGVVEVKIYSTRFTADHQLIPDQVLAAKDSDEIGRYIADDGSFAIENGGFKTDKARANAVWSSAIGAVPEHDRDPSKFIDLKYYKACRDVNAGAFHVVLARFLSQGMVRATGERPQSFVLDITPDAQVWNQAIYSFASEMGEPTRLEYQVDGHPLTDPFRFWRAPGTSQLVDVYTTIQYDKENGPLIVYSPGDDHVEAKTYHYTLELNEDGFVIGGEMHGLAQASDTIQPLSGPALIKSLQSMQNDPDSWTQADMPDFMWFYKNGSQIGETTDGPVENRSIIHAAFIKKLHDCSVASDGTVATTSVDGVQVPYKTCSY